MTNKPMLSVERELRGAVEQALLAIKRIYQAGHDGIVSAGGSCDQPGMMFEGDPTVRELRALLDAPVIDLLDKCGVQMVDCPECTHQWDHFFNCGNKPAPVAVEQPAPVAVVMPERETYTKYLVGVIPHNANEVNAYKDGWNTCLEEVSRLNGVKP